MLKTLSLSGLVSGLVLLLAACGDMPQLAAPAPPPGPAPSIVPLEPLLVQIPAQGSIIAVDPTGLSARAERLRARAATMRGPVADPETRARLLAHLG